MLKTSLLYHMSFC